MDIQSLCAVLFLLSQVCGMPTRTSTSLCLPGTEFDTIEGKCKVCPDGYYSTNGLKCLKCATCHKGQEMSFPCEKTRNTRCLCPPGKYEKDGICKECTNCPAGLFQKRDCGHNLNRQCEECPKGYSTHLTNSKKCLPNKHKKNPPATMNEYHIYNNDDWKVVFSVVAIIISLIAVAVICYCIRRRKRRNNQNNTPKEEEESTARLIYHFPEEVPAEHVLYTDVPYNVIEELAKKLNPNEPSNNWRTLASHLGFSTNQINNIALHPQDATQDMLLEWSCGGNASVYILHDILLKYMNRKDAADILEPFILKEIVSTV